MRTIMVALGLFLCSAGQVAAWGDRGHSIIAEIAQRHMAVPSRVAVEQLLGYGVSLASQGSWADDERTRNSTTTRWHFVNIPLTATSYDPVRDCRPDPNEGDC